MLIVQHYSMTIPRVDINNILTSILSDGVGTII